MKIKSFNILSLVAILLLITAVLAISAYGFGFEKNIQHRESADAESVAGCMESCEDMLAGWLEMNPDSENYNTQKEKIEAKAEQCLAMNELAGFPFTEEEILHSCGLWPPGCVLVSDRELWYGACTDISWIEETNLPQCCAEDAPGGINCGENMEWVVGITAFPVCYISNS